MNENVYLYIYIYKHFLDIYEREKYQLNEAKKKYQIKKFIFFSSIFPSFHSEKKGKRERETRSGGDEKDNKRNLNLN